LNANPAMYYGDRCLLTKNKKTTSDILKIFNFIEKANPKLPGTRCRKEMPIAPPTMRQVFTNLIQAEIKAAKNKKPAAITIKLNSIVDKALIDKLYDAAHYGVQVKLIIRGICCVITNHHSFKYPIHAISIIDEYLEHAR